MKALYIVWDVDPRILPDILPFEIRWYGLLFAAAFFIGFNIMTKIYEREGKPIEDLDTLLMYIVLGTVIGARLGHCLFYQPDYYLSHPIEILKVWKGGLASHGAAIGIFTALYLYTRKKPNQKFLWLTDRLAITVALGGFFIRLGNLINSEIVGIASDVPWAFIFLRAHVLDPETPRHPTQLYESLSYLAIFVFMFLRYKKLGKDTPEGSSLGYFLSLVFGARFFWEFFKENQVGFEEGMALNMGQILSIPLVLCGIYLIYRSKQLKKVKPKE